MKNKILNLKELSQKAKFLPDFPGVYLMKDKNEDIIYIGKAKNLKNRVSSYFIMDLNRHENKVRKMVENISAFDYIVTDSEFEALILECSLIKKYKPKYNILLKDSKGYNYVKITKTKWPMIFYVKQKINDDSLYIGPYVNSFSVRNTVEEILNIFKLPKCKRDLNKIYNRPCLYFYINKCCAPCVRNISNKEYIELVEEAKDFLKNGISQTVKIFKQKMEIASNNMNFETPEKFRDKIHALENINSKQKVVSYKIKNQDVIAMAESKENISIEVFRFKDGDLYESKNFILPYEKDKTQVRTEFLKQFYSLENALVPSNIILDGKINDTQLINKMLSETTGKNIKINIPKSGEALKLIDMCKNNAYENLLKENNYENKCELYLEDLKNILCLNSFPKKIEAYDISNLFGSSCVGAMIVFKNGKPFKKDYRKFNIGYSQDDYNSIKQVLKRRFDNFKNNISDSSFNFLPDLILIDGGSKHVKAGKEILKEMNLKIPLFGMVKDKKHRTKALTSEIKEIKIKDNSYLYSFITLIQNEVHRYAINYHKNLRGKNVKTSKLTLIKGIGEIRAKALLKAFKSFENISKASLEELKSIKEMNKQSAFAVYNHFREKN